MNIDERGTLKPTEPHPAAFMARQYIRTIPWQELLLKKEALASCAIEGNRLAEVCLSTLNRLLNGHPVSDRYLLGLAWFLREGESEWKNIDLTGLAHELWAMAQLPPGACVLDGVARIEATLREFLKCGGENGQR